MWILWVVFNLRAQALNVHVDKARIGSVAVTPDRFEQGFAGMYLPGLARHLQQEVEFQRSQRDLLAALAGNGVLGDVDKQVPHLNNFSRTPSIRRRRARIRAMSSFGLKGLVM